MRAAIATQECTKVDAHFGWARHLMIFEVSAEGHRHIRTTSFHYGLVRDGKSGKLPPRLRALRGCDVVFVADVGPEGARELARNRILPLKTHAGQAITIALDALSQSLRSTRVPWLRKLQLRRTAP